MGLAERRAIKAFQDERFPKLKAELDQAAGYEVPLEVQWDTLAVADYASLYAEAIPKVFFQPLSAALRSICADDMGKSALRETLKKIVITNSNQFSSTSGFGFAAGVLSLDHTPTSNIDNIEERTTGLIKLLESGL